MTLEYWKGFRDGLRSAYITFKRDREYYEDLDPDQRLIKIEQHLKMHMDSLTPHMTVTKDEKKLNDIYEEIDDL
jgi:hypothetical protein